MPRFKIEGDGDFGYVLRLNNLLGRNKLDGRLDQISLGPCESIETLRTLYENELVEPYDEEGPDLIIHGEMKTYTKYFRKGGSLEWCCPLNNPAQWEGMDESGAGLDDVLLRVTNITKREPCE